MVARPFDEALQLVKSIATPMMVTNTVGAAMFMRILLDRRAMFESYTTAFSARALKIAACTEGMLRQGFNQEIQHEGGADAFIRSWISARWRLPIVRSCWRLSGSATITICQASPISVRTFAPRH